MGILKESEQRRNKMMQKITSDAGNTTQNIQKDIGVETPIGYTSLRNDITSVDTLQETNAAKGVSDLIRHRIDLRKGISNGTVSSGNEAQDYLTMRKSGLVDIFSDYMMQDKNIIKSDADAQLLEQTIKKDPDAIISYMKNRVKENDPQNYEVKNKAIDDYIMKGGKLNDVMDFVIGEAETPYGTKKDEKLKGTNMFLNFLGSIAATPIREVGGLTKIVEDKTGLGEYNKEKARETAMVKGASTAGYNQYKTTGKLPEKYSEDYENLYKGYDEAVKDGFVGSVEEYNNYLGDVAVATDKTFKKVADDFTEKYLFNPEETGGEFGQVAGDIIEIVLAELASGGAATPALMTTKIPKVYKYANWAWKALKGGAEFQALEDAYEGELSDVSEYAKSSVANALLAGGLSTVGYLGRKALGGIYKGIAKKTGIMSKRDLASLEGETPTSSQNKIKVIEESMETNPKTTVEKEMAKPIVTLREKVKKDVDRLNEEVKTMERSYEGEESPKTFIDELNSKFSEAKDPEKMGQQVSKEVPELRIGESREEELLRKKAEREALKKSSTKEAKAKAKEEAKAEKERLSKLSPEERAEEEELAQIKADKASKKAAEEERARKYKLTVDNEELLKSGYSKDKIALIDVLIEERNKMFVKEGREFNASNLWELTKMIESKSTGTEGTSQIVEVIKNTMETVSKGLGTSIKDYGAKSSERWDASTLLTELDNLLGRLSRRTSKAGTELGLTEAGQKIAKNEVNLRELLTIAKEKYGIDLNKEIDSWIAHLAIYDPEAAAKLAKDIYPSLPGMLELLLKTSKVFIGKQALKATVNKGLPPTTKGKVWDAITTSVRGKTAEGTSDWLSNEYNF